MSQEFIDTLTEEGYINYKDRKGRDVIDSTWTSLNIEDGEVFFPAKEIKLTKENALLILEIEKLIEQLEGE